LIDMEADIGENHYSISSSFIVNKKNCRVGFILLFHDMTLQQSLIKALQEKNQQADVLNGQLLQEMAVDDELLMQNEHRRLTLSIHKILEEKMLEVKKDIVRLALENSEEQTEKEKNLKEIADQLRDIMSQIRRIVYQPKS